MPNNSLHGIQGGSNTLELAAAGGRKTQRIVDTCATAPPGRRILVLTYTTSNQNELRARLAEGTAAWLGDIVSPDHAAVPRHLISH